MFKTLLAATLAIAAMAGAAQASTYNWDVSGTADGAGSTGGTHTVTAANGDGSTVTFAGNPSPSLLITGQTGLTDGGYSNAFASYTYNVRITPLSLYASQALYGAAIANGGTSTPTPVGTATGYAYLAGTQGSFAAASVQTRNNGYSTSCDSGAYGTGCGLSSYSLNLFYTPDDYCPGIQPPNVCTVVPTMISAPTISLTLNLEADVFGGNDEHVFAFIDPTITLNDSFFTSLNLSASDYALSFDEGEGNAASIPSFPGFGGGTGGGEPGAVPEPATWAMMLLGFGGLGGVLRARRRRAAFA